MQCPHLVVKEEGKSCGRMLERGLDVEVADFDIEHFSRGNPTCCYYFREPARIFKHHEKKAGNRTNNLLTTAL